MIEFDFGAVLAQWPLLARGVAFTVDLTAVSAVLGMALGVACAWARTWGPRWLGALVAVYVELIRNTPFIVQLFFIYFGLTSLGVKLHRRAVDGHEGELGGDEQAGRQHQQEGDDDQQGGRHRGSHLSVPSMTGPP